MFTLEKKNNNKEDLLGFNAERFKPENSDSVHADEELIEVTQSELVDGKFSASREMWQRCAKCWALK